MNNSEVKTKTIRIIDNYSQLSEEERKKLLKELEENTSLQEIRFANKDDENAFPMVHLQLQRIVARNEILALQNIVISPMTGESFDAAYERTLIEKLKAYYSDDISFTDEMQPAEILKKIAAFNYENSGKNVYYFDKIPNSAFPGAADSDLSPKKFNKYKRAQLLGLLPAKYMEAYFNFLQDQSQIMHQNEYDKKEVFHFYTGTATNIFRKSQGDSASYKYIEHFALDSDVLYLLGKVKHAPFNEIKMDNKYINITDSTHNPAELLLDCIENLNSLGVEKLTITSDLDAKYFNDEFMGKFIKLLSEKNICMEVSLTSTDNDEKHKASIEEIGKKGKSIVKRNLRHKNMQHLAGNDNQSDITLVAHVTAAVKARVVEQLQVKNYGGRLDEPLIEVSDIERKKGLKVSTQQETQEQDQEQVQQQMQQQQQIQVTQNVTRNNALNSLADPLEKRLDVDLANDKADIYTTAKLMIDIAGKKLEEKAFIHQVFGDKNAQDLSYRIKKISPAALQQVVANSQLFLSGMPLDPEKLPPGFKLSVANNEITLDYHANLVRECDRLTPQVRVAPSERLMQVFDVTQLDNYNVYCISVAEVPTLDALQEKYQGNIPLLIRDKDNKPYVFERDSAKHEEFKISEIQLLPEEAIEDFFPRDFKFTTEISRLTLSEILQCKQNILNKMHAAKMVIESVCKSSWDEKLKQDRASTLKELKEKLSYLMQSTDHEGNEIARKLFLDEQNPAKYDAILAFLCEKQQVKSLVEVILLQYGSRGLEIFLNNLLLLQNSYSLISTNEEKAKELFKNYLYLTNQSSFMQNLMQDRNLSAFAKIAEYYQNQDQGSLNVLLALVNHQIIYTQDFHIKGEVRDQKVFIEFSDLIAAFEAFKQKIEEKGLTLASCPNFPIDKINNMQVGLGTIINILDAAEQPVSVQWKEISDLDLSPHGAYYAMLNEQFKLVTREMQITPSMLGGRDKYSVTLNDLNALKENDEAIKTYFFRYLGTQNGIARNIETYRQYVNALEEHVKNNSYSAAERKNLYIILAYATTGINAKNGLDLMGMKNFLSNLPKDSLNRSLLLQQYVSWCVPEANRIKNLPDLQQLANLNIFANKILTCRSDYNEFAKILALYNTCINSNAGANFHSALNNYLQLHTEANNGNFIKVLESIKNDDSSTSTNISKLACILACCADEKDFISQDLQDIIGIIQKNANDNTDALLNTLARASMNSFLPATSQNKLSIATLKALILEANNTELTTEAAVVNYIKIKIPNFLLNKQSNENLMPALDLADFKKQYGLDVNLDNIDEILKHMSRSGPIAPGAKKELLNICNSKIKETLQANIQEILKNFAVDKGKDEGDKIRNAAANILGTYIPKYNKLETAIDAMNKLSTLSDSLKQLTIKLQEFNSRYHFSAQKFSNISSIIAGSDNVTNIPPEELGSLLEALVIQENKNYRFADTLLRTVVQHPKLNKKLNSQEAMILVSNIKTINSASLPMEVKKNLIDVLMYDLPNQSIMDATTLVSLAQNNPLLQNVIVEYLKNKSEEGELNKYVIEIEKFINQYKLSPDLQTAVLSKHLSFDLLQSLNKLAANHDVVTMIARSLAQYPQQPEPEKHIVQILNLIQSEQKDAIGFISSLAKMKEESLYITLEKAELIISKEEYKKNSFNIAEFTKSLEDSYLTKRQEDFKKHHKYDRVRPVISAMVDLTTNAPLDGKAMNKLNESFAYIYGLGEEISAQDKTTIQENINALRVKLVKDDLSKSARNLYRLQLLAYMSEVMYRSTGMYPNSTQHLSLINCMLNDKQNLISEIPTGQGKSLIIALGAAMMAAEGYTVDVCTSNQALAAQDHTKHKKFFDYIGLRHMQIDANSTRDQYQEGGIYYSDVAQLSLARSKFEIAGGDLGIKKPMLVLDESDFTPLDDLKEYRNAIRKEASLSQESNKAWLYTALLNFAKANKCNPGEKRGAYAERALRYLENNYKLETSGLKKEFGADLIKQMDIWLESARSALVLKEGDDFLVDTISRDGSEYSFAYIYANDRKQISSRWGDGVHQFLHARLNIENKENPKSDNLRPEFPIEPETMQTSSISATNFLNYYNKKGGIILGFTGTSGVVRELQELIQKFKFNILRIPPHDESKRITHKPVVTDDDIKAAVKIARLKAKTGQPVVIVGGSPEKDLAIYEAFKKDPILCKLNIRLFNDSKQKQLINGKESEDNILESDITKLAGEKNSITITTAMLGRGTDFQLSSESKKLGGLCVVQLGFFAERIARQIMGRSARKDDPGEVRTIYTKQELRELLESNEHKVSSKKLKSILARINEGMVEKQGIDRINRDIYGNIRNIMYDKLIEIIPQITADNSEDPAEARLKLLKAFSAECLNELEKDWKSILNKERNRETQIKLLAEKASGAWVKVLNILPASFNNANCNIEASTLIDAANAAIRDKSYAFDIKLAGIAEVLPDVPMPNVAKYNLSKENNENVSQDIKDKARDELLGYLDKQLQQNKKIYKQLVNKPATNNNISALKQELESLKNNAAKEISKIRISYYLEIINNIEKINHVADFTQQSQSTKELPAIEEKNKEVTLGALKDIIGESSSAEDGSKHMDLVEQAKFLYANRHIAYEKGKTTTVADYLEKHPALNVEYQKLRRAQAHEQSSDTSLSIKDATALTTFAKTLTLQYSSNSKLLVEMKKKIKEIKKISASLAALRKELHEVTSQITAENNDNDKKAKLNARDLIQFKIDKIEQGFGIAFNKDDNLLHLKFNNKEQQDLYNAYKKDMKNGITQIKVLLQELKDKLQHFTKAISKKI